MEIVQLTAESLSATPPKLGSTPRSAYEQKIVDALTGFRFHFTNEDELQAGIALALGRAGIAFEREKVLSRADLPDFLLDGRIVIEVKVKGTFAQALRQVARYASHPGVEEIFLVGTPSWLLSIPDLVRDKPVISYRFIGSML